MKKTATLTLAVLAAGLLTGCTTTELTQRMDAFDGGMVQLVKDVNNVLANHRDTLNNNRAAINDHQQALINEGNVILNLQSVQEMMVKDVADLQTPEVVEPVEEHNCCDELTKLLPPGYTLRMNEQWVTVMNTNGHYKAWSITYSDGATMRDGEWVQLYREPTLSHCDMEAYMEAAPVPVVETDEPTDPEAEPVE